MDGRSDTVENDEVVDEGVTQASARGRRRPVIHAVLFSFVRSLPVRRGIDLAPEGRPCLDRNLPPRVGGNHFSDSADVFRTSVSGSYSRNRSREKSNRTPLDFGTWRVPCFRGLGRQEPALRLQEPRKHVAFGKPPSH